MMRVVVKTLRHGDGVRAWDGHESKNKAGSG